MSDLTDDNWGVGCHLCHCCGDADHRHGEILSKWVDRAVAAEAENERLRTAMAEGPLTFAKFQARNKLRCEEGFGHLVAYDDPTWPIQNWALAIAGEAGELCNLVKKCLRGDFTVMEKRQEILAELADVMTYCDLAVSSLSADTATELKAKFDIVSGRIGWVKDGEA